MNDNTSIEFILIPPGEFIMGSKHSQEKIADLYGGKASTYDLEHPQHPVQITKPFYLSIYEITQLQWNAIMENNPMFAPTSINVSPFLSVLFIKSNSFASKNSL